jgi:hypothetical protein
MMRTHWWYKFLTKDLVDRRKYRALKRKGLFDADAYVSRYPDVETSGMDALKHFIVHGMAEGRVGIQKRNT